MTPEHLYWAKAIALVGDDLSSCTLDRFEDKRDKFVAVLRNAAYRFCGDEALDGHPVPADSIHDICHNLNGTVDAQTFAAGCAAEQRRLFGCAPDADALQISEAARVDHLKARALATQDKEKALRELRASSLAPSGEALLAEMRNAANFYSERSHVPRTDLLVSIIQSWADKVAALLASQETLHQGKTLVCDECSGVIPAAEPIILCDICGPKDRQADIDAATVELRAKWEAADAARLTAEKQLAIVKTVVAESCDVCKMPIYNGEHSVAPNSADHRDWHHSCLVRVLQKQLAEADAARRTAEQENVELRADKTFWENMTTDDRLVEAQAALTAAITARHRLADLLLRLRGWDMLDGTADGPYWRAEIDAALTDRLSADPGTCPCPACRHDGLHSSGCAVHNEPAERNGPCDCGRVP